MSDDVGQRVSSEAGGQEREALERLRSYLAVTPIGSLFDRSTQMLLRDVLAALDAANSRAEEAEDKLDEALAHRPWVRVAQDAETRIQGLETALRKIGQHPARYGIDASDFALDALSQATKRKERCS